MRKLYPVLLIILFSSCVRDNQQNSNNRTDTEAFVPIYASLLANTDTISLEGVRSTVRAGKIYAYSNYIFQNEENEGIHIVDNSDTDRPKKIAFLRIPFNTEIAVKGDYVYANNNSSLMVIDMQDPLHPAIVRTVKDVFPARYQEYPPERGAFVCPDSSKGKIVYWELRTVKTANCRR